LQLPALKIVEQIKNKTLNKLDELIVEFTRNYSRGASAKDVGVSNNSADKAVNPPRRSIREVANKGRNNRDIEGAVRFVISITGTSSSSLFMLSTSSS
jgi:hypothetical protein